MTDGRYVTWDRWDAEHAALRERVSVLERFAEARRGLEAQVAAIVDRISDLEAGRKEETASDEQRRNRAWMIGLAVLTGLICPLVVTTVITVLHLHAAH